MVESKQLSELWAGETRNFSPANVSFRHHSAELLRECQNVAQLKLARAGNHVHRRIRELAIAGDLASPASV